MAFDFGSLFDDIRDVGDSVSGFFDSSLGKAISGGVRSSGILDDDDEPTARPKINSNFVGSGRTSFRPSKSHQRGKSANIYDIEAQWLRRLSRFGEIVGKTEVKL